jgi:hypothetical protein
MKRPDIEDLPYDIQEYILYVEEKNNRMYRFVENIKKIHSWISLVEIPTGFNHKNDCNNN